MKKEPTQLLQEKEQITKLIISITMNVNRVIEHIGWNFGLDRVTKNALHFQEMASRDAAGSSPPPKSP